MIRDQVAQATLPGSLSQLCDFTSLSNKLEKQESNFALKIMLCQVREMNSHVQQLQLASWQVGAKGLVGHLSNPLYCS